MKIKVQVVTITDDGQETTREIACVERQDLTPETLGLSLAEGKAVLQALQEVVVEWQMHAYLQQQRACPHCGQARRSKGVHHTVFRTVFGALPVKSPGWAVAAQGQAAEGLAQMQQGQTVIQAVGQRLGQAFVVALLAEQYGRVGQAAAGVHMLREALAVAHTQGLRIWEAELHRLRGVLLHQATEQGSAPTAAPVAEAESCMRQALDIARRQGAKAFELRAALSLSRLWQRQGKRAAARQLLAAVYGWFTEGFDTADLQEAKALLEELRCNG